VRAVQKPVEASADQAAAEQRVDRRSRQADVEAALLRARDREDVEDIEVRLEIAVESQRVEGRGRETPQEVVGQTLKPLVHALL